jgi:hypothetical protein
VLSSPERGGSRGREEKEREREREREDGAGRRREGYIVVGSCRLQRGEEGEGGCCEREGTCMIAGWVGDELTIMDHHYSIQLGWIQAKCCIIALDSCVVR